MTDWRPGAALPMLQARARLNASLREFFLQRGVLEVETPLLCAATATDLHLASFTATQSPASTRYLQTSPELAMKRLLAAGSGPIYQLGKAFRAGDSGARHNPEFTLLEWYRPGWTLPALMSEVEELLAAVLPPDVFGRAAARHSYRGLFEAHFGVNPHLATEDGLRALVSAHTSFGSAATLGATDCLDLLFSMVIEPSLGQQGPDFVHDFPAAQASLSQVRVNEDGDRVAQRCEVYLRGLELANGYQELVDAAEQRRRMAADNAARRARGLETVPLDERFLAALDSGLPACAGVALGVDRLLMLCSGAGTIDDVLAFAFPRC